MNFILRNLLRQSARSAGDLSAHFVSRRSRRSRRLTQKKKCNKLFGIMLWLMFVSSVTFGQRQVLPAEKIGKLLPYKVKGYAASNFKNSLIALGTLRYSLAERSFTRGNKSMKVLLFDYAEAPIMFDQAIRKWSQMNHIENDSVIHRPYAHPDSASWESYSLASKKAQIVMGINKRFFLTVTGEKLDLEELHQILTLFPFEKYPK